jgi:hypothetical protein
LPNSNSSYAGSMMVNIIMMIMIASIAGSATAN